MYQSTTKAENNKYSNTTATKSNASSAKEMQIICGKISVQDHTSVIHAPLSHFIHVVVQFYPLFYFILYPIVLNSLSYITIPKNNRKIKFEPRLNLNHNLHKQQARIELESENLGLKTLDNPAAGQKSCPMCSSTHRRKNSKLKQKHHYNLIYPCSCFNIKNSFLWHLQ